MLSRCIYCRLPLTENQTLENFRIGRRIAFDPGRGRLWAVCGSCRRWNLAPIEERWEALEELEKLSRDRGRLLSQTDHIALFRLEDLDVVRVGRAQLAEEAWWRYGQELQRRRQLARQHGHPILLALAVANQNLQPRELHILDPQAQHLHQTHAGAVQGRGVDRRGVR